MVRSRMTTSLGAQWSVTMFSFTNDIVRGREDDAVRSVATHDLARTVEFDGPQHFASLPNLSPPEIDSFRRRLLELDLMPTQLGIYDDAWLSPTRRGSPDERVASLERQIRSAHRLGFQAVKIAWGKELPLLARLRPCLEDTGLMLTQEAQGSLDPDSPDVLERIEFVSRHPDSFAFVFDLSACMTALPVTFVDELARLGVDPLVIQTLGAWGQAPDQELRERVLAAITPEARTADFMAKVMMPFGRFGHTTVAQWRDVLRHTATVHLKFWDLDDEAGALSTPVAELLDLLDELEYAGPLTSEWGGHEWLDQDAVAMTRGHRALCEAAR
jgi:hypothetical protein